MTPRHVDRLERCLKWCGLLLSLAALGVIGGYLLAHLSREPGFPQWVPQGTSSPWKAAPYVPNRPSP